LREDFVSKTAKAVADGKPHLVPAYERIRERALITLCPLDADVAGNRADIAAANQKIAANKALSGLYIDAKRLADKITSGTETPKDVVDLHRTHQALKNMNAARPDAGTLQVIQLLDGVLAKYKRLQ
jgi:hypothetical protein